MSATKLETTKSDYKYLQWADELRRRIRNGEMQPGDPLPSQKEMKELHGVSQPTAERVYALLEQDGLVERRARSGVYVAHPNARRTCDTICVVCPGFGEYDEHPYYAQLIGAAHRLASADGMRVLLCNGESAPDTSRLGGVLYISPAASVIQKYGAHLPRQVPLVSVLSKMKGVPAVMADELDGTQEALVHLLELGHSRIGMLATYSHASATRVNAYQNGMYGAGHAQRPGWLRIMPPQTPRIPYEVLGYRCMKEWLEGDWEQLGLTALLCQNDDTAIGVLRAVTEAGIRVPGDLSLVGFDGTKVADLANPRLTTIEMPLEAMIARAWRMLVERRHPLPNEWPTPEIVMLSTRLRVAQSTAKPPSERALKINSSRRFK